MSEDEKFGRTIQLFLVDGLPSGLIVATLHGWTGSIVVCRQPTFDRLLKRPELDRTGLYILHGQDPDNPLKSRAYIGEADRVKDRIGSSAAKHEFWDTAVAITTADDALTKGDVRYLEARLIEMASAADRVSLANSQQPEADRRRLPEAGKANMEAFLANIRTVLPVVGLELLRPKANPSHHAPPHVAHSGKKFEIRHRSGVRAIAYEDEDEFVVMQGSEALRDSGHVQLSYRELKRDLVKQGVLKAGDQADRWIFVEQFSFKSPSAAAAIVLDRNANGRKEWKVEGEKTTYHEWQEQVAL